jgi:hypothetical protein
MKESEGVSNYIIWIVVVNQLKRNDENINESKVVEKNIEILD